MRLLILLALLLLFVSIRLPSLALERNSLIAQILKLEPLAADSNEESQESDSTKVDATPMMSWINSPENLKAAILCVHGLGLHKGTYAQFGERMAGQGYAVYAVDVRGFGSFLLMPGERKCNFGKCLSDVSSALVLIRKTHPTLPVFILGESMGGAIALRVTAMHPELVDGLISSVPAAQRYGQARSALKVGLKLLTAPTKEMSVADDVVSRSTKKADLKKEWSSDPLARFELTPLELLQFQKFMEENSKSAGRITDTPVLMVQGASDALVRQDANVDIVNRIPSKDSQLVFVDKGEHLIFEEGQFNDDVIAALTSWLESHTKKRAS